MPPVIVGFNGPFSDTSNWILTNYCSINNNSPGCADLALMLAEAFQGISRYEVSFKMDPMGSIEFWLNGCETTGAKLDQELGGYFKSLGYPIGIFLTQLPWEVWFGLAGSPDEQGNFTKILLLPQSWVGSTIYARVIRSGFVNPTQASDCSEPLQAQ